MALHELCGLQDVLQSKSCKSFSGQAVKAAVALHELQRSKGVCEGAEEQDNEANEQEYPG